MRALMSLGATAMVVAGLVACSPQAANDDPGEGNGALIGVAMPSRATERWIADGDTIKAFLESEGYAVELQYANDDIPTQVLQVETMIANGAQALIVAPIDGTTLTGVLEPAAEIPVISYDRLIRNTGNVDYFAAFDQSTRGQQQAIALLHGLGLAAADGTPAADAPAGPFSVELFAGPVEDAVAAAYFAGAMGVLQPLVDAGTLVIGSGQVELAQVGTPAWATETAQARMSGLLAAHYSAESPVHAVLSPHDDISRGVIAALEAAGFAPGDQWPVISGHGAGLDSLKAILADKQFATIFEDSRDLATAAAQLAIDSLSGATPDITDEESFDNGVIVVPAILIPPVPVTAANLEDVFVGSGFWAAEDLGL